MEWVIDDFAKSELQPSWWTLVLEIKKVPLQGSYSVPTGSALVFDCNVKVFFPWKFVNSERKEALDQAK
jgi:hypothetical protein